MSGSSGGYCPICGKSYGPEADCCPLHGFLFQSRDALRPGVVIDGAFEILQRLGAGGMGETYLVRHAFLGENLVFKRVRPELAEDPLYQQSFLREAHSLAALRKLPAVVEIRNAWQTREGYLALLLEYVEGGNLLQWLDTARGGGPLELLEAVAIAADLAKALAAAHAIGVLHRDVKPQNILMRQLDGGGFQLKLCDFGLAVQRVEEMTRQGATATCLGTPGYAAPEQYTLSSREQDARVDVFGLGMTLYRLAAGRLPWDASDATWPLVCKEQQRKSLKELRPALERESWLENLLLRMTAVERNDRIATAAEALELMEEVLAETRPAPAMIVMPQPRIAPPPIELRQLPPPLPGTSAAGVPVAVPGGTPEELRKEAIAGPAAPANGKRAVAPTPSPEPQVPPPAELQQPPLRASGDTATEHEVLIETVASTGGAGEESQVEPTASVEMPAGAAVAADDKSAAAMALGRLSPRSASPTRLPPNPPTLHHALASLVGAGPALGDPVPHAAPAISPRAARLHIPWYKSALSRVIAVGSFVSVILAVAAGFLVLRQEIGLRQANKTEPPVPAQPVVTQERPPSPVSTGATTSYSTYVGARFEVIKNGDGGRRYLLIHGNEYTARKVLRDYLQRHQGTGYLVVGADRFVEYDGAKLDPNRLFSREGAEKNLRRLNVASISPKLPLLLDRLDQDRGELVSVLTPPPGGLLVAPHNTSMHSIRDEIPISDLVSMKDTSDPFSFMLCTSESDYVILARSPYNVVLQLRVPKDDDGSLSRLAARVGIRYVNIETPLGQTQKQLQMIGWVDDNLP